jgi:ABC-type multidrug transport system fused ATPase/permease subunit
MSITDSNLIDIADENEGATILGRHFYTASPIKAFLVACFIFSIIPLVFTLMSAYFGKVLLVSDTEGLSMSRDYASLSFLTLGILLPPLVLKMMNTIPITVESLSKVIELDTENNKSTMTEERLSALVNTYSYLYCKETGRKTDNLQYPPKDEDLDKFIKIMNRTKLTVILLAVGYTIATAVLRFGETENLAWHNAEVSLIGFVCRTITDFLGAAVLGPLVFYPIILSVMITFHSLKQVSDTNSLKYIRFSKDEAGGLGEYGWQSFLNTIAILPIGVVLIGIIIQARMMGYSIAGMNIFVTIVYFMFVLFVFFFPLSSASSSMGKLKKKELADLSKHYANSYLKFKHALEAAEELNLIKEHSEAMIAAETVFDGIMKQPTVPYSKALIARLAGVVAPVFGTIGGLVIF